MEYDLYHDESKEKGYWHGMLLVPISKKQKLINYLETARKNTGWLDPLSLKSVKKNHGKRHECAKAWAQIGIASLMSRVSEKSHHHIYLGKSSRSGTEYSLFEEVIGAKLIIFRNIDNFASMAYVNEYGSKVEITFRIGLKGALHSFGLDDEYIHINKIHFDGHEHYHRKINQERAINRIRNGLRSYCHISDDPDLIDDRSSDHSNLDSQEYDDCQLLQLTDLLVSSFRSVLSSNINLKHRKIISNVKPLIDRYFQGHARMLNSRWRNSLWMSQSYVKNGSWVFDSLEIEKHESIWQPALPGLENK